MSHQTSSTLARHSNRSSSSSWWRCSRASEGAAQCPQRPNMATWRRVRVRQVRRVSRRHRPTWLWRPRCRSAPQPPRQPQPNMACTGRVRPLISCCPHTPFTAAWAGVLSGVHVLAKVSPHKKINSKIFISICLAVGWWAKQWCVYSLLIIKALSI